VRAYPRALWLGTHGRSAEQSKAALLSSSMKNCRRLRKHWNLLSGLGAEHSSYLVMVVTDSSFGLKWGTFHKLTMLGEELTKFENG
jgi:hypothetical protein